MKLSKVFLSLCCAAAMLLGSALPDRSAMKAEAASPVVFQGLTATPFADGAPFKGVDVSSVIALERSGVVYRDVQGNPCDIFHTLAASGVNTVRVRIWNDPYHSASRATYGGGACDVDCAVAIAKRCADAGLAMLLDFHYSDFWADPAKQKAPKAWEHYNHSQKAQAIYEFTANTLQKVAATGVRIAMVQIGNETTGGMCGTMLSDYDWSPDGWQLLGSLWNAGAKAVREFDRNILVAVHFTNPEKAGNYEYYAKMLAQCNVDYDVFASSYYPYWHGTMANLTNVLNGVAKNYQKLVMVAETSWLYTKADADFFPNTISGDGDLGSYVNYAISPEGQTQCIRDVFAAVAAVENGKGIGAFYWEPAWLSVGSSYDENLQKWERDGSGWATQASMEYDPDGKYYGGSSVDNQALFDASGKPLSSLSVFQQIRGSGVTTDLNNLLENPGFEMQHGWTDRPTGWTLHPTAGDHFDVRQEDPYDGACALHWYSETAFSDSTAAAAIQIRNDGAYEFSLHMQGDVTSHYVLTIAVNGTVCDTAEGELAGWNQWLHPSVSANAYSGDQVRIQLRISGGAGSYGSADACTLYCRPIQETTASSTTDTTTTTTATTTTAPPQLLMGDVDENGVIAIGDVVLLCRFVAEDPFVNVSLQGRAQADLDHDGKPTASDAALILRRLAMLD